MNQIGRAVTALAVASTFLLPGLSARAQGAAGLAGLDAAYPSGEDFGVYGRVAGVPSIQLRVGASEPGAFAKAKAEGTFPPGPHNSGFAPDRERTIRGGVAAYTLSVLELLGGPSGAR